MRCLKPAVCDPTELDQEAARSVLGEGEGPDGLPLPGTTPAAPEDSANSEEASELLRRLIGALAMLLIDRGCRGPYIASDPGFDTLLSLCHEGDLPARAAVVSAGSTVKYPTDTGSGGAGSRRAHPPIEALPEATTRRRRIGSARVLTGLVQRSAEARLSLVRSGSLGRVMALLNPLDKVTWFGDHAFDSSGKTLTPSPLRAGILTWLQLHY